MKGFLLMLLVIIGWVFKSCDRPMIDTESCEDYTYETCNLIKPEKSEFIIRLTPGNNNNKTPLKIIKGYLNDGDTILDTAIYDVLFRYPLPLNEYYTVVATYFSGNDTIYAIDGSKHILKEYLLCDSTCYVVKEGKVIVELQE